ncbi:MAG TPA: hypothetical protein V6D17_14125 [Candidatus Obscuribacterales bacterium]
MFLFGGQKVEVTVIDIDDGSVITRTKQNPADLPERFDQATTVHLGGIEYDVVEAEPPDRATYSKSCQLLLKVRPATAQVAAPDDILFSLPTISNDLGAVVSADTKGRRLYEMHEDDWRQIEVVSKALSPKIELELAGIEEIYRERRVPAGFFQAIHVRKEIPEPLAGCHLSLSYFKSALKAATAFDCIAYFNTSGLPANEVIQNGFAFEGAGGIIYYGLAQKDAVSVAGLKVMAVADASLAADTLSTLLSEFELVLVDWCRQATIDTKAQLQRYFETIGY